MTSDKGFLNPAPYHLLCYGTLLGTEIFHSFIGGIISYRALSRPQFSVLQQQIFPWYFGLQTLLPLVLAALGPSSSFTAFLDGQNFTHLSTLTAVMFICGLANWTLLGPMTTKTIKQRKHQETKDGKKYLDSGPKSEAMQHLNKKFSMLHGISSLVNLIEIIASIWYGVELSQRL